MILDCRNISAAAAGYNRCGFWGKSGWAVIFKLILILCVHGLRQTAAWGEALRKKILINAIKKKGALYLDNFFTVVKRSAGWRNLFLFFEAQLKANNFFLFCVQVASSGVHGPVWRLVSTSPCSVGGAQPPPALVHSEPHRDPTVWISLHHAHRCKRYLRRGCLLFADFENSAVISCSRELKPDL